MAATEMGEVDEIHSNEDNIKDGVSINGDISGDEIVNKETNDEELSLNSRVDSSEDAGSPANTEENDEEKIESDDNQEEDADGDDGPDEPMENYEEEEQDDDDDQEEEENAVNGLNSSDEIIIESVEKNSEDVLMVEEKDPIELADDNKDPIEVIDGDPLENGNLDDGIDEVELSDTSDPKETIINIDDSPLKKKRKEKTDSGPPRRSSRNLNRERKSYIEEEEIVEKKVAASKPEDSEESDIEEIMPQDPLADADSNVPEKPKKLRLSSSSTIVVKDTKCLAEIASKSTGNNKKEPTLVIIDTNSILSGRGPVPLAQKTSISTSISSSYSMLPMALPAQGVYPANMRATITPIPMTPPAPPPKPQPPPPPPAPVLPTLTDDMFVVEAPSFIVPYVYEKPPIKDLKEFIKKLEKEIGELKRKKEEKEKEEAKKEKEEENKEDEKKGEQSDKEKEEKDTDGEKENERKNAMDLPSMSLPSTTALAAELRKSSSYFDSPLGKFFMGIGYGLVQEAVQTDLLKQQKRRRDREGGQNPETMKTINSLLKNLEYTKENNEPYHMESKKCEFCSFKTESALAMAYHLETPHMKNYVYRCNFCPYEVRSPHDILFHMEVQHGVRGRLERAPAFHQCPNCPFEDNQKGKLSRHLVACARKFRPERNLEPPADFEPPAKIPRAPRMKQQGLGSAAAMYQAMARNSQYQMMSKMAPGLPVMQRGRGRPSLGSSLKANPMARQSAASSLLYKQANMSGGSVLVPTNYQLSGNQLYQVVGGHEMGGRLGSSSAAAFLPTMSAAAPNSITIQQTSITKAKPVQQPSISITPLPRGAAGSGMSITKPGETTSNSKNSFVICEICDGYIKDLEQLRNHMQWIHKVKIHPKMIYNRPPLNCQKCQFRFFTDQGLERHLLGSHGLVTSSMQEAANKSKDAGRCPVCGRVYQWKLLNHVARDHNMTLKPAHLSYKCTVCTATFGMYKQFESHVYSAHSVVAKRVMDKKNTTPTSNMKNESVLKPLKINDEITIIPQPAKPANGKEDAPSTSGTSITPRSSIGYSNGSPSTSKGGSDAANFSLSRSERLARRKTVSQDN